MQHEELRDLLQAPRIYLRVNVNLVGFSFTIFDILEKNHNCLLIKSGVGCTRTQKSEESRLFCCKVNDYTVVLWSSCISLSGHSGKLSKIL